MCTESEWKNVVKATVSLSKEISTDAPEEAQPGAPVRWPLIGGLAMQICETVSGKGSLILSLQLPSETAVHCLYTRSVWGGQLCAKRPDEKSVCHCPWLSQKDHSQEVGQEPDSSTPSLHFSVPK